MRGFIFSSFFFLFFNLFSFGQSAWLTVFQNPETDFQSKVKAFDSENTVKSAERGSGVRQFERWRWMAEQRLTEEGNNPDGVTFWKNYQSVSALRKQKSIGDAWQPVGPVNVPFASYGFGIGRVNVIAFHPTDTFTMWAGAPSGGLWKTVDGGNNWTTNTDFLSNLGISDIAINPHNPDEMYIATGDRNAGDTESFGVLKSVDGGQNWDLTGLVFSLPGNARVYRLLLDSAQSDVLFAATSSGIYKTVDGGVNWDQKTTTSTRDLEFAGGSNQILLAVEGGTVLKTTDGGDTWNPSGIGIPTDNLGRVNLAVSPSDPSVAYIVMANQESGFRGVCRTEDTGDSWTLMSESPNILGYSADGSEAGGQGWYDLDITVDPENPQTIWVGGINVWRSINGGTTWFLAGHWTGDGGMPAIHADQHFLCFHPLTKKMWIGNDGGVWTDVNGIWFIKSNKMSITQYYRFGTSKLTAQRVIAGSQDNGTHFRNTGGWVGVYGGDGMESMIDHTDPNIVYATIYYGRLFRSEDAGGAFQEVSPGDEGAWVTPFFMDPQDPQSIYSGFDRVKVSYARGGSWFYASPVLTNSGDPYLLHISVPETDASTVYVARRRAIYKGVDFAADWINISSGLPTSSSIGISYVATDPFNAQIVYVTLSGYSDGNKVFKSTNGGQTWQNITGNLPNIAVFCIEPERSANRGLYVGTEFGVFFKDETMTDWVPYGTDFPNVQVTELEITDVNGKLRACTFGRGVWEIDIQNPLISNNASVQETSGSIEGARIYPNPGTGIFQLSFASAKYINRVLIVNSQGVVVKHFPYEGKAGLVSFDVAELPAGVYFARLISEEGITHHRFIKR